MDMDINTTFCHFLFPTACIYIGSTRGLKEYTIKEKGKEAQTEKPSTLAIFLDAMKVPVLCTLALVTIYFSLKHELTILQNLLKAYVLFLGWVTIHQHMLEFFRNTFQFMEFHDHPQPWLLGCSRLELGILVFTAYLIYVYLATRHWFINNYIAMSVCVYAIEKWQQTRMLQVFVIFAGLMLYDVSFVFGTDVMMTVATGFESPMKILFPTKGKQLSMIGIGDVIVPGLLSSMCLRADFITSMVYKVRQQAT